MYIGSLGKDEDFLLNARKQSSAGVPKKLFSKISQYSQENTFSRASILLSVKKEDLMQVFPCELCKNFKNAYFIRHP